MTTVNRITLSATAAVQWAKANDAFSLLECLFPYEDREVLTRIWSDPEGVLDQNEFLEIDLRLQ